MDSVLVLEFEIVDDVDELAVLGLGKVWILTSHIFCNGLNFW